MPCYGGSEQGNRKASWRKRYLLTNQKRSIVILAKNREEGIR